MHTYFTKTINPQLLKISFTMNHNEKIEILEKLSEQEFRQDVIVPLLSKMGFIAPMEYHGTNEKGKDIICFEYDKLREQRFLSVVAKVGDLTGSASTNAGLMNVVNQVQQAFDNPYDDLFNMNQVNLNEVWIMTTGKIVSGAEQSVIQTLRKHNLDKQIRFISNIRLIQLIDSHFSTYWNSNTETKESVIIQRDRLLNFIERLLQSNNVDKVTIESVKSTILYSDYSPSISKNTEGLYISRVSPYSIEFSVIDKEYDDYIFSKTYGITKEYFSEAKNNLARSFSYIEETIDHANRISKITNPEEFISESYNNLTSEYPFHNSYGNASDFLQSLQYLEEGLYDLKYFKKFLIHKNKFEWAKELSESIPKLLPEITTIVENCKEEELIINYSVSEDNRAIMIQYNAKSNSICFTTRFKLVDTTHKYNKDNSRSRDGRINPTHIVYIALSKFRIYLETILEYDELKWQEESIE